LASCYSPVPVAAPEPPESVVDLAVARGRDALSFLAVESGMRHWFDVPTPEGTGACVAYVDTSQAWVAACSPLVDAEPDAYARELSRAAARFVDAARASGRRACFFASDGPDDGGLSRLLIGEQPIFRPREWVRELSRHRRLREQLRRARAKGVRVRRVPSSELAEGLVLRLEVERLADDWLRSRHIEPMGFLVAPEPFRAPSEHRYFVAELGGRPVGFLSAVPIGRRRAWLVEDVFRGPAAPNGTTETLIVALMRDVEGSEYVTLGLTPLSGALAWPLRVARWVSRPLFDFQGLRAFRDRLHPQEWQPVWLAYPPRALPVMAVVDSLRAFARGSLLGFAARSLARHPSGLPWALALPLPVWTAALAWLVAIDRASLLGFPRSELALWTAFDVLLLLVLVRVAMRPRRSRMLLATSLAAVDAVLSLGHLAWVGFGSTSLQASLRGIATIAPAVGALLLAWATTRTAVPRRTERSRSARGTTNARPTP
jgi:phosphatidylglycerol lysyltransferase